MLCFFVQTQADGEFSLFGTVEAELTVVDAITVRLKAREPVPFKIELYQE